MLFLIAGCQVVVSYECETTTLEVADDELANDLAVTADDVLDVVVGSFSFDAEYDDGELVTGDAEVARGEGPAIATDGTLVERRSRGGPGFGRSQWTEVPPCDDALEVPVDVAVATDDGQVDFAAAAVATTVAWTPDRFEVRGEPGPDAVLPAGSDPSAVAGFALRWTADGFDHVSLWFGSGDADEQVLESVVE